MSKPKISIITVVWNDKAGLERTIQSIINQTYDNVEFIIIDGGSSDGTVDVIKAYEDKIDYWVSEKDHGIYDAMNKGIRAATGTWVNFMNAGDTFVDNQVLEKIHFEEFEAYALVYGNKIQNGNVIYPLNIKKLKLGEIMACHQSMFFNKKLLNDELLYDLNLPIYADYELVNKIYFKNYTFQYINLEIAIFEGGGISSVVSTQKRKDKYKTVFKYYGFFGLARALLYRSLKGIKIVRI